MVRACVRGRRKRMVSDISGSRPHWRTEAHKSSAPAVCPMQALHSASVVHSSLIVLLPSPSPHGARTLLSSGTASFRAFHLSLCGLLLLSSDAPRLHLTPVNLFYQATTYMNSCVPLQTSLPVIWKQTRKSYSNRPANSSAFHFRGFRVAERTDQAETPTSERHPSLHQKARDRACSCLRSSERHDALVLAMTTGFQDNQHIRQVRSRNAR